MVQSLGAGWMNLASLGLGLVSWALPLISTLRSLARGGKMPIDRALLFSFTSVCACAAALCFQLHYSNHLVRIEDWGAMMDTSDAVVGVSTFLLLSTLGLNAVALLVCYYKTKASTL